MKHHRNSISFLTIIDRWNRKKDVKNNKRIKKKTVNDEFLENFGFRIPFEYCPRPSLRHFEQLSFLEQLNSSFIKSYGHLKFFRPKIYDKFIQCKNSTIKCSLNQVADKNLGQK